MTSSDCSSVFVTMTVTCWACWLVSRASVGCCDCGASGGLVVAVTVATMIVVIAL